MPHRASPRRAPRQGGRQRLGQHFLAPAWAQKVVRAIDPQPGDVFIEIGPGRGALTLPLAATGVPVLAVEIDRTLAGELAARVPGNVTILTADILQADVLPLIGGLQPQRPADRADAALFTRRRIRVAGNLPYYIASPIMFRLLDWYRQHGMPADATVMVQREVADRLLARTGTKEYGVLTILVGVHATVTRVLDLPPGAFRPAPRVRSTVVRLTFGPPRVRIPDAAAFERVVKAMFGQRRKMLGNALKAVSPEAPDALRRAGIDPARRPETLDLAEIAEIAARIVPGGPAGVV